MLNKISFVMVALFFAAALTAQTTYKYGHMNLGNLLEAMPEVKIANEELKKISDKFEAVGDSLTTIFEQDYRKLATDYQAGLLTPIAAQKAQDELEKRQQYIKNFGQDAERQLEAKRGELLAPILKRIQDSVDAIAKEHGFHLIFDTGSGVALFALETEDVTHLVKKKLGI